LLPANCPALRRRDSVSIAQGRVDRIGPLHRPTGRQLGRLPPLIRIALGAAVIHVIAPVPFQGVVGSTRRPSTCRCTVAMQQIDCHPHRRSTHRPPAAERIAADAAPLGIVARAPLKPVVAGVAHNRMSSPFIPFKVVQSLRHR